MVDVFFIGFFNFFFQFLYPLEKYNIKEMDFFGITVSYSWSFWFVFCLIYFFLFDVITQGRTIGKTILKIKVVNQNNTELSRKRLFIRSSLKVLNLIFWPITGVLFLLNSWTLQDKICNTKTVNFLHSFSEEGN